MDAAERKRAGVVTTYAVENFSSGDWLTLGQLTGRLPFIQNHPRLFRAMSFGDDDYEYCAAEILDRIFTDSPDRIDQVIEQFDIDLWYSQKAPDRYQRVFGARLVTPEFWRTGYLRAFISHLVSSREKVTHLKNALEGWGITSFVAHQDIQPSKEWQSEIEAGLLSMDVLVAIIEPGFRESLWTDQEVGFALGRNIDVLPLLVGEDPHGFIGKIQGIHVKGKLPSVIADDVVQVLLRKPKHRRKLISGLSKAISSASSKDRITKIRKIDGWGILADPQIKELVEASALTDTDKMSLRTVIDRVGAFELESTAEGEDDDVPF